MNHRVRGSVQNVPCLVPRKAVLSNPLNKHSRRAAGKLNLSQVVVGIEENQGTAVGRPLRTASGDPLRAWNGAGIQRIEGPYVEHRPTALGNGEEDDSPP